VNGRRPQEVLTVDELRFDGRVVAITGAHHGLGREHALLLAGRGAQVVVNDIQGAADTVDAVRAAGGEAIENTSDITTGLGADRVVRDALDTWGRLDAVVNNAAAGGGTLPDEDTVRLTLGVHLVGTVNMVRAAMPAFRQQRYGRVVNTGSGSVLGIPGTGIYAAGKGGVLAFSRVLANELASERDREPDLDIKVNVFMPAAQTPVMPRVPDEEFQAMLDTSFAPARTSPLVAVLAHESCPVSGEAIQTGAGRVSRFVLATTEGWQAPDDRPTPESILEHWPEVMANRDLQEPVGSMSDLLGRRGLHPYTMADLVRWAKTGEDPNGPTESV
jgi:NAD(P)-dependent dehydrogenase (short-subunit alcohol dehydrogenase family)